MNKSPVYQLRWDFENREHKEYEDLFLKKFEGSENTVVLSSTSDYDLPSTIEFQAHYPLQPESNLFLDYPANNMSWPIMSKRMYQVVSSAGAFAHKQIKVQALSSDDWGGVESIEYVAIQLLQHQNYFDRENSVFTPHPRLADKVKKIDKLVLNLPPQITPLFRLDVAPHFLFVSQLTKQLLEEAKITGTKFVPIDEFSG